MSEGRSVTEPVPTTPATAFEKWKFIVTPAVIVLLFLAQNQGWLTPAQVEIIRPLVSSKESSETTTVTTTVEATPEPAEVASAAMRVGDDRSAARLLLVEQALSVAEFDQITLSLVDASTDPPLTIRINSNHGPQPPPDVDPIEPIDPVTPKPVTPLPDDVFGLTKASYDGKRSVASSNRASEAKTIASAHREAARRAATNPFGLIATMQTEVTKGIAAVLTPTEIAAWKPWSASVMTRTKELQSAGKLADRQQWIDAFGEIATGLEVEP